MATGALGRACAAAGAGIGCTDRCALGGAEIVRGAEEGICGGPVIGGCAAGNGLDRGCATVCGIGA